MKHKWLKLGITNFVTLIRVVGIVALIPVYKVYGGLACFLLSAGCFATDFLDGMMARGFKCSTFFGSLFDGISDKAFLIVNMLLLMSITPMAIIPIILELGIATVQTLKYQSNLNVQSNMFGKVKMWIAGLTISLCYLLVDKDLVNYLGSEIVSKLNNLGDMKLFGSVLLPLVLSEIVTLGSYIKEYKNEKEELTPEKVEERKVEEEKIENELNDVNTTELLFDHDMYEKYKDYGNLKLIRTRVKKRK